MQAQPERRLQMQSSESAAMIVARPLFESRPTNSAIHAMLTCYCCCAAPWTPLAGAQRASLEPNRSTGTTCTYQLSFAFCWRDQRNSTT